MPLTWKIKSTYMHFAATGHYTFAEVVDALHEALSEASRVGSQNLLLDISGSNETRSPDELRNLAELFAKTPGLAGTCAVLVQTGSDLHYGLARMLGAFAEPLGLSVGIFESEAEAREFVALRGVQRGGVNGA